MTKQFVHIQLAAFLLWIFVSSLGGKLWAKSYLLPENHPHHEEEVAVTKAYEQLAGAIKVTNWEDKTQAKKVQQEGERVLAMAEGLKDQLARPYAITLGLCGLIELKMGNYVSSLAYYDRCLDLKAALLPEKHNVIGAAFDGKGRAYRHTNEIEKALEAFDSAHVHFLAIENVEARSKVIRPINNAALAYKQAGAYGKSMEYFREAMQVMQAYPSIEMDEQAKVLLNVANVFIQLSQVDSARKYLNLADACVGRWKGRKPGKNDPKADRDSLSLLAQVYVGRGLTYELQGRMRLDRHAFDTSVIWYERALPLFEQAGKPSLMAITHFNIGASYQLQGSDSLSEAAYARVLAFEETLPDSLAEPMASLFVRLADGCFRNGQRGEAIGYLEKYMQRKRYQPTSQAALMLPLTAADDSFVELMREGHFYLKNKSLYMSLGALGIMCIMMLVWWGSHSHQQRTHKQAELVRYREQQEAKEERNRVLNAAARAEERQRTINEMGREIHQQVCNRIVAAFYRMQELEPKLEPLPKSVLQTYEKSLAILKEAYDNARSFSHRLEHMNMAILPTRSIQAFCKEVCAEYEGELSISFDSYHLEDYPISNSHKQVVMSILRELLVNVKKHAEAKWVGVQLFIEKAKDAKPDTLVLNVEDNGKGFEVATVKKANGLRIFNEYMHDFKGVWDVQSQPGSGSQFLFEFPLPERALGKDS